MENIKFIDNSECFSAINKQRWLEDYPWYLALGLMMTALILSRKKVKPVYLWAMVVGAGVLVLWAKIIAPNILGNRILWCA